MVYIILGDGFEEMEAIAPGDILRRGGVEVKYVGVGGISLRGGHGIDISANTLISRIGGLTPDDVIVIPGGLGGVESIENSPRTMQALEAARQLGVRFAAICAGPRVLSKLGILVGKHITCYPGCESDMQGAIVHLDERVVQDGDLITGRAPGSSIDFGLKLLESIKGAETAAKVRAEMYYE